MAEPTPEDIVAAIEAKAGRIETPCGDGVMVWRSWGDGPALVLLHGAFGSWNHWIRNILPLAERFRVLVPDMPGYGASAMPPLPYSPESLGEIIAAGIETVVAATTSWFTTSKMSINWRTWTIRIAPWWPT